MYSIGELSRHTGVKVPTIRYYEQMGVIDSPLRSEGNQRRYSLPEVERLAFVKHARDLGLSIETIKELLQLGGNPEHSCDEVDQIARQHLQQIKARIRSLRGLERELVRIVDSCSTGTVVGDCGVLKALGDHGLCEDDHHSKSIRQKA